MKIAFFSFHGFEKDFILAEAANFGFECSYFSVALNQQTAPLAKGFDCVCCFVNDHLNAETLFILKAEGVQLIALRSAGYNNVDLAKAHSLGILVVRVPAYSPYAVAEHSVGLLLSLNRKIHKASQRVHDLNFSLDGLVGFDLFGKSIGVIGGGRIGSVFAKIMLGFGCKVFVYDPNPELRFNDNEIKRAKSLDELYRNCDVISLHLPLLPQTQHLIDAKALAAMKPSAILINTGRGALIDSIALIEALKSGKLAGAALDVYEEEDGIFFEDLSNQVLQDDVLARLLSFPNVLITAHQGFLTKEALQKIAKTTFENLSEFQNGKKLTNQVLPPTNLN